MMSHYLRKIWMTVFSLIVFVMGAYFIFEASNKIGWHHLLTQIYQIRWVYVVYSILTMFVFILVKSFQAYIFFSHLEKRPYFRLIPWVSFWLMLVQNLPFWIGDIYFMSLMQKKEKIKTISLISFFTLEQIFEALLSISLLVVLFIFFPIPKFFNFLFIYLLGAAFLLIILIIFLANRKTSTALSLEAKNIFQKVRIKIQYWISNLHLLKSYQSIFLSYGLILSLKLIEILSLYFVFISLNISTSFFDLVFVVALLNFTLMIPAAPANFGPFEASIFFSLQYLGHSHAHALSVALLFHLVFWLTQTILGYLSGFYLLISRKLSLKPSALSQ